MKTIQTRRLPLLLHCTQYAKAAVVRLTSFCNVAMLLVFIFMAVGETPASSTELVVIANPRSGVDNLSHDEVIDIFMGRSHRLPSGISVQPIDLPASQNEKADFYHLLVNKDLAEITSYWARLHFSGRISPPMEAKSSANIIEMVAKTPGAIGYIKKSMINSTVIPVFELGEK